MNKYHYEVIYKFSEFFNTLWRMAIIFPILLSVLYYLLNYKWNSPFPLWVVILASFSIVVLMLLIRFIGHKEIKASDIYHFYITDKKVVSKHPLGSEHRLSYEINTSDIVALSSYASSSPSYGVFRIKTKNGNIYEVPGNYVNTGKTFKTIQSLRPELEVSRKLLINNKST